MDEQHAIFTGMTTKILQDALRRVEAWPEAAQVELAEIALEIDAGLARCESGGAVGELRDAGVMNDSLEQEMDQAREDWSPHSAHWGAFSARWNGATLDIRPYAEDPAPSSILQNFTTAMRHKARILRPMVRKAWLDRSKSSERSFDQKFVACPWDEVLDLLANELSRIRTEHGAAAVFGGSYGWSSAGRFHHAQSQVHRFLNTAFGGYVRSVNSYSAGASAVILPHILGGYEAVSRHNVTWDQVAEHTDTVLAFGGMALKNSDVASGGISRHIERDAMQRPRAAAPYSTASRRCATTCRKQPARRWLPIKVGTDVALMLALAHTLLVENLWDSAFVARYCTGFEIFERYLLGRDDDTPKDAAWAAGITGIPAADDRRPRPPAAARAHPDHGLAFAAAGAIWRAAGVDGRGARGHARPDRPARRRI